MYRMLVLQVKEMLELNLSVYEIAHRLKVDTDVVQTAIDIVQGCIA